MNLETAARALLRTHDAERYLHTPNFEVFVERGGFPEADRLRDEYRQRIDDLRAALAAPDPSTTPGERCGFVDGTRSDGRPRVCGGTPDDIRHEHFAPECQPPHSGYMACHDFTAPTTPPAPVERAEVERG